MGAAKHVSQTWCCVPEWLAYLLQDELLIAGCLILPEDAPCFSQDVLALLQWNGILVSDMTGTRHHCTNTVHGHHIYSVLCV